jgi:hypothetical protein
MGGWLPQYVYIRYVQGEQMEEREERVVRVRAWQLTGRDAVQGMSKEDST